MKGKQHKIVTAKLRVPYGLSSLDLLKETLAVHGIRVESTKFPCKPGRASSKGSQFERELAKQLSIWWSYGEDEYIFSRRGGSGGAFRDRSGNSDSSGDIQADKGTKGEDFTRIYSVEAKFYADLARDFAGLFNGKPSTKIKEFWKQAKNSAAVYNRYGLLIMKQNGSAPICITDHLELKPLVDSISLEIGNRKVIMFSFSNFLSIDPRVIKHMSVPEKKKIMFNRK